MGSLESSPEFRTLLDAAPDAMIVLSAAVNVDQQAARMGVKGYLKKPVELSGVFKTIERYC